MHTYPSGDWALGSIIKPLFDADEPFHLVSSTDVGSTLSRAELAEFLSLENVPIRYQGELYWSNEVTAATF
ncbi:MAG: hypothetical protein ABEJ42_09245 [Halobacteriaceae archaeon]